MFVAEYGSQSFFLSIFSNQRVLLAQQQCQTRIRLIIFMCMIWPSLEKKLSIIGSTSPPGPWGSPLSSMSSKPFCAVQEQRTRNKSQRQRQKWRKQKSGEGVGKKEEGMLSSPPPPPSFIFWVSFHFSRGQNRKSSTVFFWPETKRKRLLRRLPTKTRQGLYQNREPFS